MIRIFTDLTTVVIKFDIMQTDHSEGTVQMHI